MPGTEMIEALSLSTLLRTLTLLWWPGGGPPLEGSAFLLLSLWFGGVPFVLFCLEPPNDGDAVEEAGVEGK